MHRHLKSESKSSGQPPATLMHVGRPSGVEGTVTITQYGPDQMATDTSETFSPERIDPQASVRWLSVIGVHDLELVASVGEHFGLHPLTLEDIADTRQRPKVELHEEYILFVVKCLGWNDQEKLVEPRQLSIVLTRETVLGFAEQRCAAQMIVADRLREGRGRVRQAGPDYLAYVILDAVVDRYFTVLERIGERIEQLEEELLDSPDEELLYRMQSLKQQVLVVRKLLWPLREAVSVLQRRESRLITDETATYLRDLYDHIYQVIDAVETYREMLSSMLDVYLSSVSNRLNVIMSVLTVIGSIFIPLTFVAGIYGMNFEYMPELDWRYGYPAIMIFMGAVALIMLWMFKRRKWL